MSPSSGSSLRLWFVLLIAIVAAAAAGAADLREELSAARRAGDGEAVARIERSIGVSLEVAGRPDETPYAWGFADEPPAARERWGMDVLVADREDVEGRLQMASTQAGHFYIAVESMESGNNCLNVYKSADGGATWSRWFWICPPTGNIVEPTIAVPEAAEDYVFVGFIHQFDNKVARIRTSTGEVAVTTLGTADGIVAPRMITDNLEYASYYVYALTDGYRLYRTIDRGESWTLMPVPAWGFVGEPLSADLAYADGHLYALRSLRIGLRDAGRSVLCSEISRSDTDGASWNPAREIGECYAARVAAQRGTGRLVAVFNESVGGPGEVWYAISFDQGDTWGSGGCISQLDGISAYAPDIAVGPGETDDFHCVFLTSAADSVLVRYRGTEGGLPWIWNAEARQVNDTPDAANYTPSVVFDWARGGAGVAWSDTRTPTSATFFDAVLRTVQIMPDGSGDYATIQAAIDASPPGTVIELWAGTYSGAGNRELDFGGKSLVLRSRSRSPEECIIDLQGSSSAPRRFIRFHSGEGRDAVVEGFTVRNGYRWDGGAITCTDVPCSPTIRDCIFEYNHSTDDGGALHFSHGSAPRVEGCVIRHNTAADLGGGIHAVSAAPEIVGCVIRENAAANDGGGLSIEGGSMGEISACSIHGNTAANLAGGLMLRGGSAPVVRFCTITANEAGTDGGGVCAHSGVQATLESCTIAGNAAPLTGGLRLSGSNCAVSLEHTIIAFSPSGAAIGCVAGQVELACCDLYGNAGGDYTDCAAGYAGIEGNFSANPLFCGFALGDYTLNEGSPCAVGPCGQVGALGVGCAGSAVGDEAPAGPLAPALRVARNPSAGQVTLWFDLPGSQQATLTVLDVAGRAVRRLAGGVWPAGRHSLTWDGRDDAGRPVGPGLYFVRIDGPGPNAGARALLLR